MRRTNFGKDAHYQVENNPWGRHGQGFFEAPHNLPVRCPACNRLCEPGFMVESVGGVLPKCPNCSTSWGMKTMRDMSAEAMQVQTQGGWTPAKLEALGRLKGSGYVNREEVARPMNRAALKLTEGSVAATKTAVQRNATKRLIDRLRNQSSVSRALRWKP